MPGGVVDNGAAQPRPTAEEPTVGIAALAYDTARGRVVLFGGGAAPPATATSADLFADTWELPAGQEAGPGPAPGPEGITLVSFTISPESVGLGEIVTFAVGLDQPAPAPADVAITMDGTNIGALTVDPGQTLASASVQASNFGLPAGTYGFTATLGPVTLSASLTLTSRHLGPRWLGPAARAAGSLRRARRGQPGPGRRGSRANGTSTRSTAGGVGRRLTSLV